MIAGGADHHGDDAHRCRYADPGMTNTDYWALRSVEGPMPMKDLAHCMNIDPSYVILVADRLEQLRLIERQPHPTDRRVKNLVPNAKGRQLKKTIPDTLWNGPNMFSALTDIERANLTDILMKLIAAHTQEDTPPLPDPTEISAAP